MTESFTQPTTTATQESTFVPTTPTDKVEIEVGGRKYTSPQEIATKITHADKHIETLEGERAKDRETIKALQTALNEKAALEDVLARMQAGTHKTEQTPVDIDALAEQVFTRTKERMTSDQIKARQEGNLNAVLATITPIFGDNKAVDTAIAEKCSELGITVDDAVTLAKKSPDAFYKTMGIEATKTIQSPTMTSIRSGEQPRKEPALPSMDSRSEKANTEAYLQRLERAAKQMNG